MKVLFLPLNYGSVVQDGLYDAFRENGCELEVFDYFEEFNKVKNNKKVRQLLINKANQVKPDLLFVQIQHTNVIDSNTILGIKKRYPNCIIVNWTQDVRNYIQPTYKRIGRVSDFNFIPTTGQLDFYRKNLSGVYYIQTGYNPKRFFSSNNTRNKFEWDAIFTGNFNNKENYPGSRERQQTCRLLRKKFGGRFALFGHGWPKDFNPKASLDQQVLNDYYHKSFCCISVSHFNDLSHYFSDRLLMCMASGRPTISLGFPGWESYFTDMCDLVIADSVDDIPNKVQLLLENKDLANYIGQSGADKVFAEHTYYSRVKEILELVGLK